MATTRTTVPGDGSGPATRRRRATAALVGVAAVGVLLTACTSVAAPPPEEKIAPSLEALFEQYLARDDLSPFERDVLERAVENGEISAEDYGTAHAREAACMTDAGYDIAYEQLSNGLYRSTPNLPRSDDDAENGRVVEEYLQAAEDCSRGVSMVVESLYTVQQGNPDLLVDQDEVAVRCLRRAGLVPDGYTAPRFATDLSSGFADAPFDPDDGAAQACLLGAGVAFASATP